MSDDLSSALSKASVIAHALNEWRDAGAPAQDVAQAILAALASQERHSHEAVTITDRMINDAVDLFVSQRGLRDGLRAVLTAAFSQRLRP